MGTPAFAEVMAVEALTEISTQKPEQHIQVKVIRDCSLGGVELKDGYILNGKILNVTDPKRLKQNASFTFYPMTYTDMNGKESRFSKVYVGTYSPKFEIDAGKVAKSAVLTAGNRAVKGLKTGYYAVEGAVKNEEGNRIKSAAHNVYDNSILSYAEKGEQLDIKPETKFGLKFDECINIRKDD